MSLAMSNFQLFDKSIQSLKFLLALRVYKEPVAVSKGDRNLLSIKRDGKKELIEFHNPDAATRFLANNNDSQGDQWIEWSFTKYPYKEADLLHLEENIHDFKVAPYNASPCLHAAF
jgi:hypothetical protein